MAEYSQLIDDYLDGSADESVVIELKAWLDADASNLEIFAREVFIHQQLREPLLAENSARFMEAANNPPAMELADADTAAGDMGGGSATDTAAGANVASFPRGLGNTLPGWMQTP